MKSKRLFLSIALFLIWGLISWRWYVCGIKQACPDPVPEDTRPLVFEWGKSEPVTRPAFEAYRDSISLKALPEGQILEIVGLYFEAETPAADSSSLGTARALAVKKLFAEKLPEERMAVSARLATGTDGEQEKPFVGTAFNFIEPAATGNMEITELEGRILIQFPFGKAAKDLEPEAEAYFEKLAKRIQSSEETLHVTGYTDSIGNEATNLQLGLARAQYIRNILLSKGLAASKVAVDSKGQEDPIADNSTEDGQRRNRRVEIRILKRN